MPFYQIDGITPVVSPESFVHPTAVIIGDVIIGKNVYIGPNASLRGDFGRLIIKEGANVQDNCVMHGFPQYDTIIEENGHIGHGAILHGCHIKRNALVGMNSVIMDGAVIGENSIVGACSFVKAEAVFADNTLIVGTPAKAQRTLSEKEIAWKSRGTADYQDLVIRCQQSFKEVTPLTQEEPDCPKLTFEGVIPKSAL